MLLSKKIIKKNSSRASLRNGGRERSFKKNTHTTVQHELIKQGQASVSLAFQEEKGMFTSLSFFSSPSKGENLRVQGCFSSREPWRQLRPAKEAAQGKWGLGGGVRPTVMMEENASENGISPPFLASPLSSGPYGLGLWVLPGTNEC